MPTNSSGCLISAYDTEDFSYTRLANEAADRVVKYLGLPVSIITDKQFDTTHNIIIQDRPENNRRRPNAGKSVDWYNLNRTNIYNITPYDRTLLIDCDYFLNSDALLPHVNSGADFLISSEVYNPITGKVGVERLGQTHIPVCWATVMIFNKCDETKLIFDIANLVKENYDYYASLYEFYPRPVRNDYIFSIACHLAGGYGMKSYALQNYPIINCNSSIKYISWDGNKLIYQYNGDNPYKNRLQSVDLHLMNKDQL
jgi:hypothetical protein